MVSRSTIYWLVGLGFCAIISLVAGVTIGKRLEQNQFEVAKGFGTIMAQKSLDAGELDKAISLLHFAKAYELVDGSTDSLLGKAYRAKGKNCLAESFFSSYLVYVERNRLSALPSVEFEANKALALDASTACAAERSAPR